MLADGNEDALAPADPDGVEGRELEEEDELDELLELEEELELELELDDEELDGMDGIELCEDCWLVDSHAAKSTDAAPIKSMFLIGVLFIRFVLFR